MKAFYTLHSYSTSKRVLILGGEAFPLACEWQQWIDLNMQTDFNKIICNIYGITELSCWSTLFKCPTKWFKNINVMPKKVPLGFPIDDETIWKLLDEQGNVLTQAGVGHLLLGSKSRYCYIPQQDEMDLNDTENKEIYRETGDLVECTVDNELFYVGRSNRCVKRYGKRINLGKISFFLYL